MENNSSKSDAERLSFEIELYTHHAFASVKSLLYCNICYTADFLNELKLVVIVHINNVKLPEIELPKFNGNAA